MDRKVRAGSIPAPSTKSKGYSESLVTFFINVIVVAFHDFREGVRRSLDVTNPPSMFDFYVRVRPSRVFNRKTEEKSTHRNLRWVLTSEWWNW